MFFHVDEAGNTGNNLFDDAQPRLSYGMISSRLNVDALGRAEHREILRELGVDQLHANQVGADGLSRVAAPLLKLQRKHRFGFDYYYIDKPAFVVVLLFEAIFDAGLNPGVNWSWYWTALRYPAVYHLGLLLDEDLAKEPYRLCLVRRPETHADEIVALLQQLRDRLRESRFDRRLCEVFDDAFSYGISHPEQLDFGHSDAKIVSPNAVAFQFICKALARRSRNGRTHRFGSIKIDRQQQFNRSQEKTHWFQKKMSEGFSGGPSDGIDLILDHPMNQGTDRNDVQLKGFPAKGLEFCASADGIGLQIVDAYLWLINRVESGRALPAELVPLFNAIASRSVCDGISMDGMLERFNRVQEMWPQLEDLSDHQAANGRELRARQQEAVDRALGRKE